VRVFAIAMMLGLCTLVNSESISAQVLSPGQTVGNGSAIAPAAGEQEAFGINGPTNPEAFPSRTTRRNRFSGIGESFLQTTSPTRESSPATVAPPPPPISTPQFRSPKLQSAFSEFRLTPALEYNTPTFSSTTQRSWSSGLQTPAFSSSPAQFEETPSFSKRPALNEQMNFNQIDYKGLDKSRW
jgi:hypothetical protein